MHIGTQV